MLKNSRARYISVAIIELNTASATPTPRTRAAPGPATCPMNVVNGAGLRSTAARSGVPSATATTGSAVAAAPTMQETRTAWPMAACGSRSSSPKPMAWLPPTVPNAALTPPSASTPNGTAASAPPASSATGCSSAAAGSAAWSHRPAAISATTAAISTARNRPVIHALARTASSATATAAASEPDTRAQAGTAGASGPA